MRKDLLVGCRRYSCFFSFADDLELGAIETVDLALDAREARGLVEVEDVVLPERPPKSEIKFQSQQPSGAEQLARLAGPSADLDSIIHEIVRASVCHA